MPRRSWTSGPSTIRTGTTSSATWSSISNSIDPDTPCGWVGGQAPNAFGGYDYAKVMRKVQFLEAYNIGGSQAIIRSLQPAQRHPGRHHAISTATSDDTIWQTWYYLAHGNRGFIGWVEKWFDGTTPKPWHAEVAPHFLRSRQEDRTAAERCRMVARRRGDLLQPCRRSSSDWILDAAAHGKTWVNRNSDARLGSSHQGRKAWENMLRDSGLAVQLPQLRRRDPKWHTVANTRC